MKTTYNVLLTRCGFCKICRKWFRGVLGVRRSKCSDKLDLVLQKLEEIEDTIAIIARQIARWSKIEPGE